MGRRLGLVALAVGLAGAFPALAAPAACNLKKVGEFHVAMQGQRAVVEAKINGVPARLMVDSGSFFSALRGDAFDTYSLKRAAIPPNMIIRGTGGAAQFQAGNAKTFEIGNFNLTNYDFLVGGPRFGNDVSGVLGENILGGTDVEYDFANGMVRLFRTEGCSRANLAYWAADKAVSTVPLINLETGGQMIASQAKVNGRNIRVIFDTGAGTTVLKREAAAKMGFSPTGAGVTPGGVSSGVGDRMSETWIAPFDSFAIGGEEIKNTKLRVAEIDLREADMLLGADFFLSHRIYVARSQNQVYITYNGGSVFRLDRLPGPGGAGPVAGAPGAASQPAADLKTADEYTRRGKASASRRDYAAAVSDFTHAIEMEPNDAGHYFDRGAAHVGARQPVLALADLDQTLKLKPDNLDALLMRGELFLARNQVPRAKTDLEAAAALAGPENLARLRIADDYVRAGLAQDAVGQYNDWVAGHPKDRQDPQVLNSRCWARALSGKELELALADCNAAIRAANNSIFLDSRGLVYLRMGQFDKAIADYDDSLKRQPNTGWALYGRGLAKIRQGKEAEGRADVRAALIAAPGLIQLANRYGLSPPPGAAQPPPVNP